MSSGQVTFNLRDLIIEQLRRESENNWPTIMSKKLTMFDSAKITLEEKGRSAISAK